MIRRAIVASLAGLVAPAAPDAEHVQALIREACARHRLDPARPLAIARCESNFAQHWRTNAPDNPCRGVYQFDRPTWKERAPRYGLPGDFDAAYDPALNVSLAVALMANGEWWRWRACW